MNYNDEEEKFTLSVNGVEFLMMPYQSSYTVQGLQAITSGEIKLNGKTLNYDADETKFRNDTENWLEYDATTFHSLILEKVNLPITKVEFCERFRTSSGQTISSIIDLLSNTLQEDTFTHLSFNDICEGFYIEPWALS